MAVAFTAAAV